MQRNATITGAKNGLCGRIYLCLHEIGLEMQGQEPIGRHFALRCLPRSCCIYLAQGRAAARTKENFNSLRDTLMPDWILVTCICPTITTTPASP